MNKTWKVVLAFLGVFLAGAVFGGFVSIRFAPLSIRRSIRPPMEQFVPMILRKYSTRLKLTPDQIEQIRPIVKAADEELGHLRRSSFAATFAVADKMNEEISAILTPQQRDEFKAMQQEWHERMQRDRERRTRDRKTRPADDARPEAAPPPPGETPPRADGPPPPAPE